MMPSDLFLGRQPILDRRRNVVAYELLFRASASHTEACVADDARATACVVSAAFDRIGIRTVVNGARAFVNLDAEWLLSRRVEALPKDQVVLEILETVEIDAQILRRCRALKAKGYRLALDDFTRYCEDWEPLLDIVDIVKVDVKQLDAATLTALVRRLKLRPVRLLAEKVDTMARARQCLALGFDLFQGFLYGRPVVLAS